MENQSSFSYNECLLYESLPHNTLISRQTTLAMTDVKDGNENDYFTSNSVQRETFFLFTINMANSTLIFHVTMSNQSFVTPW